MNGRECTTDSRKTKWQRITKVLLSNLIELSQKSIDDSDSVRRLRTRHGSFPSSSQAFHLHWTNEQINLDQTSKKAITQELMLRFQPRQSVHKSRFCHHPRARVFCQRASWPACHSIPKRKGSEWMIKIHYEWNQPLRTTWRTDCVNWLRSIAQHRTFRSSHQAGESFRATWTCQQRR